MDHFLAILEFALGVILGVVYFVMAVFGLFQGYIYYGRRRPPVSFRDRPGAFVGLLFLYIIVAFICAREVFQFTRL